MGAYEEYLDFIDYLNTSDAEEQSRKKHRLRMECYAASESEFFFTLCARHQGKPFTASDLAEAIIGSLLWRREKHRWLLFCYCLMPDHLHFIIRLIPGETHLYNAGARGKVPVGVPDQVGDFKKYTNTQVWWQREGSGQLWQRSSYDRVIRYNQSIQESASYVLNNPVRKHLVNKWEDCPYSGVVDPW
jgi:REP element-mobilizing transposase RayT